MRALCLVAVSVCGSAAAYARSPFFGGDIQSQLLGAGLQSSVSYDLSVFSGKRSGALGLVNTFDLNVLRLSLEDRGLHPAVRLNQAAVRNLTTLSLAATTGPGVVTEYDFRVNDIPICGVSLRSVEHPSGETIIVGGVPQVHSISTPSQGDWPDLNESARRAIVDITTLKSHDPAAARMTQVSKCLFNEQGELEPVWDFILSVDHYQYRVQASESRVYAAYPRYFDATATVQAYDPNIASGTLKNFSITVDGSGTMTNSFITTALHSGETRQTSAANTFVYTGSNANSAEASGFAYANQHLDFVTANGYVWQGPKPLTVVANAVIKGNVNNALYTPFDGSSGPYIRVGSGDGVTLKNLPFDSDVVSHELGHHVIYQSITVIAGEALILHEGLADFLTFSRTGDACLGESICPEGTGMDSCKKTSNKCLRTGDNSLVYNDEAYQRFAKANSAHQQGQLVSGFLWDIRKNKVVPADTLSQYINQAITYLPNDANIKNLVAALLYTDSLNGGTYQTAIIAAASARGLDPSTLGIDVGNLQSSLENQAAQGDSSSSSNKGIFGCGALTGDSASGQGSVNGLLVLFALIVPTLIPQIRKARLVRVQVNQSRPKRLQ